MDTTPTLVVANKRKHKYKFKKGKEKEAQEAKVQLAKFRTMIVGEDLNSNKEKAIMAFVKGDLSPPKPS